MPSIKININSKVMPGQKSTTFTENLARFFLTAWQYLHIDFQDPPINWLTVEKDEASHQSRQIVAKYFQAAVNELIEHYDDIYGFDENCATRWSRDEIERHILYVISSANKFKGLPAIPTLLN